MNELDPKLYKWFTIPGFRFYEINIDTKEIRSNKHYNADRYHIMKETGGKVTLTDDYGKSRRVIVQELFADTFYRGNPLEFRANSWYSTGAMRRVNRNAEIAMDYSKYVTPTTVKPLTRAFYILGDTEL